MRRLSSYIIAFASALLLSVSCVYDFDPKIAGQSDIVAIDGDILIGDITVVTVSRSVALNEDRASDVEQAVFMNLFEVKVSGEDGTTVTGRLCARNELCPQSHFEVDTRNLDPGQRYKLLVSGKDPGKAGDYSSPWLEVNKAQRIDSLSYRISEDKSTVDICVSSSGDTDTKYVRWIGREVWEFTAPRHATSYFDPDKKQMFDFENDENTFYCWNYGMVSDVMLADLSELEDSRVVNHRVYDYSNTSVKVSFLYRVDMIQESVSEEAYRYWKLVSRNTEDVGGLFSSQPSEIRGNIVNLKDTTEVVIGYISASAVDTKRYYFNNNIVHFSRYSIDVPEVREVYINDWPRYYQSGYRPLEIHVEEVGINLIIDPNIYDWLPRRCVDCTASGGHKNKPQDWPYDHK